MIIMPQSTLPSFYASKPDAPFVYLVGAGPGDPGLLTLKAYHLLTQIADVVVYDRLISDDIIAMIPDDVERIYAGKSCKEHVMTQEEINQALIDKANEGKIVVRLKGGDPFIFGRGGEEILSLMAEDIPFEIISGVNAADGCCAALGIPLTHRGVATSVRFITGHQQKGEHPDLDWQGLAHSQTTLVIYMGLTHLDDICRLLIKHGRSIDTPAIVIEQGTLPSMRTCRATLGNLANKAEEENLRPPSLVVIGEVVNILQHSF
jgi:uroporphyrin-III C-methyltransferase